MKELDRIYPIIIEKGLHYDDSRIPQWMKDNYNLKYVSRPVVAARRIRQRLREISWLHNPKLKDRDSIFVGRNDLTKVLEERIDDFEKEVPLCLIVSGLPRIGRYSVIRHVFVKTNIVRQSSAFPIPHSPQGRRTRRPYFKALGSLIINIAIS